MRACKQSKELSALVDGRLDESRRAAVQSHVSQCDCCREQLRAIEHARSALSALAPAQIPDALLANAAAIAMTSPPRSSGLLGTFIRVAVPAAGIAVAIAIAQIAIPPDEDVPATDQASTPDILDVATGYSETYSQGVVLWPGDEG